MSTGIRQRYCTVSKNFKRADIYGERQKSSPPSIFSSFSALGAYCRERS